MPGRGTARGLASAVAAIGAGVVAAAMVGCAAAGPGATDAPTAIAPIADAPSFAAVGDSITDANSADFAAGDLGSESWATYVVDDGFALAGGWAEWGATTERMAASVLPVDADALVVLAGTNDVALGVPFATSAANLGAIVDTVGISDVLVVSIPPLELAPGEAEAYNLALEELAVDRGWRFVDASAGLRTSDGAFRDGMSFDGVHPSARGAEVLGATIAEALREE
ncbi:hypothetical protein ARHIZOSPH14_07390 [Agromyces rhizosphaerae]|uniref:SGNH hydrolase-type esterase domain-containing protein n=1 Tax=Agromyces rhizosphaerae TaxID=88374 RepID=A0A9W6CWG2_9MICO|nr:SGNH/GDSL hydrolase family protein [Agromyces rhizosphaerae]GLI26497.1 hypothetical protein ARHIZOSPH14_07390 [Agromyces rhizosphaerae]